MTILVKKDSISSKIKTVYYVVPASVRAIFIQDFAKGEISYKVKKRHPHNLNGYELTLLTALFFCKRKQPAVFFSLDCL